MEIKVDREKLHKSLQKVSSIVGTRTVLPLLNNVMVEAEGGKVKFTTSDLELRISTTIDADVISDGATTIPVKKLLSLVSCMNGTTVDISSDDKDHVKIECGSGKFTLNGLNAQNFPVLDEINNQHEIKIQESVIKRMLGAIYYAVSADDSRKVLTGVLFSISGNSLTLVATDGKRMALQNGIVDDVVGDDVDIIVPLRAVSEIRRIADSDSSMSILIGDKQCIFRSDNFEFCSKLIEGNYPKYRQVVPTNFADVVEVPTDLLKNSIQMMSLLLPNTNSFIVLSFEQNVLNVSASSAEVGNGTDEIAIEYTGNPYKVSFNPQFLIEPLLNTSSRTMKIKLNDALSPVTLEGDNGFIYVIMPVRKQ